MALRSGADHGWSTCTRPGALLRMPEAALIPRLMTLWHVFGKESNTRAPIGMSDSCILIAGYGV